MIRCFWNEQIPIGMYICDRPVSRRIQYETRYGSADWCDIHAEWQLRLIQDGFAYGVEVPFDV
jgi:hypothetical protein